MTLAGPVAVVGIVVELIALVAVAHVIGWGWAILLLLATSSLGFIALQHEGARAWRAVRSGAQEGRVPTEELGRGAVLVTGAVLLIIPGFVGDVIGLLLVLPITRTLLGHRIATRAARAGRMQNWTLGSFGPVGVSNWRRPGADPRVVDGTVEQPRLPVDLPSIRPGSASDVR